MSQGGLPGEKAQESCPEGSIECTQEMVAVVIEKEVAARAESSRSLDVHSQSTT